MWHRIGIRGGVLLGALALCLGLGGQAPTAPPAELPKQIEAIQKRLEALEKRIPTAAPASESRLDRIEGRLTRLEERSLQYRSGDPPPGFVQSLESRIQALEREIARLRK